MRIQEWKGMGENARSRMQNKAAIQQKNFLPEILPKEWKNL